MADLLQKKREMTAQKADKWETLLVVSIIFIYHMIAHYSVIMIMKIKLLKHVIKDSKMRDDIADADLHSEMLKACKMKNS